MKSITLKDIIYGIMIFALVGLLISNCNSKKEIEDSYQTAIQLKDQSIKSYKDDSGRFHATEISQISSYNVLKSLYSKELDSTAKTLKIKDNRINEFIQAGFVTHNSGSGKFIHDTSKIAIHDTINGVVKIEDDSLTIDDDGHLNFKLLTFTDGDYDWSYSYKDTLNYVSHKEKYGFLNLKSRMLVDFSMSNKNSKVVGIKQFKVSDIEPNKHFSVGPYIGIQYDGKLFTPSAGISVQYSLFKF